MKVAIPNKDFLREIVREKFGESATQQQIDERVSELEEIFGMLEVEVEPVDGHDDYISER